MTCTWERAHAHTCIQVHSGIFHAWIHRFTRAYLYVEIHWATIDSNTHIHSLSHSPDLTSFLLSFNRKFPMAIDFFSLYSRGFFSAIIFSSHSRIYVCYDIHIRLLVVRIDYFVSMYDVWCGEKKMLFSIPNWFDVRSFFFFFSFFRFVCCSCCSVERIDFTIELKV